MHTDAKPAVRTSAEKLSHEPSISRHIMRLKPVSGTARARLAGTALASSNRALWCLEVGRDFHDPVLYFPAARVTARLTPSRHTTHCPLKGETTYYDLLDGTGRIIARDIAWSYTTTYPSAASLQGRIAFDATRVTLEVAPPGGSPTARTPN